MRLKCIVFVLFLLPFVSGCQTPTPAPLPAPAPMPTGPETITFPDANLETALRTALFQEGIRRKEAALTHKPPEEALTAAELAKITRIEAGSHNITDLSGLEYCTSLTELYLPDNLISDLSPLASLPGLTRLDLGGNQINDISPLASLTNLTELDLYANQISDISSLASLTNLTGLYLFRNEISDLSSLTSLTNLAKLDLYANQISDISPLVENDGLGPGDFVRLEDNNLELSEGSEDMANIKALRDRGVSVILEP